MLRACACISDLVLITWSHIFGGELLYILYMYKGGDTIIKVGGGGGSEYYVSTTLLWALAHSHLGGSGGMLPQKIFEYGLSVSISDAF